MKKRLRRERQQRVRGQAPTSSKLAVSVKDDGSVLVSTLQVENRDSCPMTLVAPSFNFHGDDVPAGVFCWREIEAPCGEKYRVIWHKLPGGSVGCIPIEPVPMSAKPHWAHGSPPRCHTWQWISGPENAPNLIPSVHARGRWHGWFRSGRMESV